MATQVQWRGGSTAEHSTFTGAAREVTVDTQKKTLVVHDGSTAGGVPLMKEQPPVGSAGAPTYTFSGDNNTGIYSPGADQVAISTGGAQRLLINSSGNITAGGGVSGAGGLNISGAGWGVLPYVANSFVIDSTAGQTRLFATGTDASTHGNLLFFTGTTNGTASERARIDSSGRLLVGTSSARSGFVNDAAISAAVQLEGAAGTYSDSKRFLSLTYNVADSYGPNIIFAKSRSNSLGGVTVLQSGDEVGGMYFCGADGTDLPAATSIVGYVDGTPGANDMPGRIVLSTTAAGASSPTERMRIRSTGVISTFNSVGDSLNLYNANGAGSSNAFLYGLHSATNNISGGTTSIIIYTNGSVVNATGSYTTISDAKLKENIVDAGSQWDDLKAIQIRNWNFKAETGHETHRQIGPIAQELETVCPGLVFETPDRDADGNETGDVTKGVNQSVLYMKAVKALQEAMERIETLEASNTDLLARVSALESA